MNRNNITLAALAALTIAAIAAPAHAQLLFLTNGQTYTANDGTYSRGEIYVGQNNSFDAPASTVATLNIVNGGNVNRANTYNSSTTNVSGGYSFNTQAFDSSTVNISGGEVLIPEGRDFGTVNITGGTVSIAQAFDTSTVNIIGGIVDTANGYNTGTLNISGGTVTDRITLRASTAKLNFVGTGLSFAYKGFNAGNQFNLGADFFTITGTVGGVADKSYNLYIQDFENSGTGNSAARQFTFNGASPNATVVPEAGSLALLLPALGVLGVAIVRRRK